jgi:metallo-beta-lactamase class B
MTKHLCAATLALLLAAAAAVSAQPPATAPIVCKADAGWNDPATPRHIYGNIWYVGTCGITALLVTSDSGHVLIDAATSEAAPQIAANIKTLGFQLQDVKLMLATHAHLDHAGGFAALQRDTGATVVARGLDAAALERGRGDRTDPQFLEVAPFPAARNVRRVADGETVKLGPLAFMAQATPGHTPGSTTWTWDSCEGGRCLHFVYADSVTAISDDVYRYTDEAQHPGVVAAFRKSLTRLAELPCDVLLTPHPSASNMWNRIGPGATAPLVDANACRELAARATKTLDERIAKERGQR